MPLHSGLSWFCGDGSESLVPPGLPFVRTAQAYVEVLRSISKQTLPLYLFSRTPSSFSQLVIVFKSVSTVAFLVLYLCYCCYFSPGKLVRAVDQLTALKKPFVLMRDRKLARTI